MSAESTTITISPEDATSLTVVGSTSTVISYSNVETTILNAAPATIGLGVQFSNDLPLELANTGIAGTSTLASRSDHRHPSTGMFLNGGNF